MTGCSLPYCSLCKKAYRHIDAHYRTKKHLQNVERQSGETTSTCSICCTPSDTIVKCYQCVHTWCNTCDRQMHRCPYCRLSPSANPVARRRAHHQLSRLLHQMERWRKRGLQHNLSPVTPTTQHILIRMSWDEVGVLSRMIASSSPSE